MLSVTNISCTIGGFKILKDLSFSLSRGEVAGIIGPNGSGKTTFFNCLSGFAPVQRGNIYFDGKDITRFAPDKRATLGISRVFQNFGIFRSLSVLQNVSLAYEAKLSVLQSLIPNFQQAKKFKAQAEEVLSLVGLQDHKDASASSLSGGQMRLLEIARAIAANAKLILLDEPTAGVSPKMKDAVLSTIASLIKAGKTILVIEHDMAFIRSFVQRMIVFDQGTILLDGAPPEVMNSDVVRELYFGK